MTYFYTKYGKQDLAGSKSRNEENKTCLSPYPGAFEQLFCPGRVAFASLFSKSPNSRWSGRWGGGGWVGGWALLELTDALFSRGKISCFHLKAHLVFHWCLYNNSRYFDHCSMGKTKSGLKKGGRRTFFLRHVQRHAKTCDVVIMRCRALTFPHP